MSEDKIEYTECPFMRAILNYEDERDNLREVTIQKGCAMGYSTLFDRVKSLSERKIIIVSTPKKDNRLLELFMKKTK